MTPSPGAMPAAADARGVDIIQNCEVTGIRREGGRVTRRRDHQRLHRRRARSAASPPAIPACMAAMAGLRLPIESHPLQALVSEPIKPVLDTRGDVERGPRLYQPVRQGRAGDRRRHRPLQLVMPSAAAFRSSSTLDALVEMFPIFSRLRMLRQWGGIVDCLPGRVPDHRQDAGEGLYFNCGWGTGGFKATPGSGWVFAHTIAQRPAAPAERAVRAGPLRQRPPDRRARRRRASRIEDRHPDDAADRVSLVRAARRDANSPTAARRISRARSTRAAAERRRMGRLPLHAQEPEGRCTTSAGCHAHGCRRWFNVARDTVTHGIPERLHDAASSRERRQ